MTSLLGPKDPQASSLIFEVVNHMQRINTGFYRLEGGLRANGFNEAWMIAIISFIPHVTCMISHLI